MTQQPRGRKIILPDYCCPDDVTEHGFDEDCDCDFPPGCGVEHDTYVEYKCSRCGGIVKYGVYQ